MAVEPFLQTLVRRRIDAEELDRTAAAECARVLVLLGCMDGLAPERGQAMPTDADLLAWDVDSRISHAIAPVAVSPNIWAVDLARRAAELSFATFRDPSVLSSVQLAKLAGVAYGAGREVARRWPDVAHRWLEGQQLPEALPDSDPGAPLAHGFELVPTSRDAGLEVLASIHRLLMIDELWTVREERAFTWTANRLAQRIAATPLFESLGYYISVVSIETVVVTDVEAPQGDVERLLSSMNAWAAGSGYTYRPDRRDIVMTSYQSVHDETVGWRSHQLASFAILQVCLAEADADQLAVAVRGQKAVWAHPVQGERFKPDDMLNVIDQIFRPEGQGASRFADEGEMAKVGEYVADSPHVSLGSSAQGVCVEVAFGQHLTSLVHLRTDITHPVLGSGLLVSVSLPLDVPEHELASHAAALQREQAIGSGRESHVGGWAVHRHEGRPVVGCCSFLPNRDFAPGLVLATAIAEITRAQWAHRRYFPGIPEGSAWAVVQHRMGLVGAKLTDEQQSVDTATYGEVYESLRPNELAPPGPLDLRQVTRRIGLLVTAQLMMAERAFLDAGEDPQRVRELAKESWPIGYVFGMVATTATMLEIDLRGADAHQLLIDVMRTVLGAAGVVVANELPARFANDPQMAEGGKQAQADLVQMGVDNSHPQGLLDWLTTAS